MKRIVYFGVDFEPSYSVNQFIAHRNFETFESAVEYVDNRMNEWQDWFFKAHPSYKLHDVVCRASRSELYRREYLILYDGFWYVFKVLVHKKSLALG